MGLFGIVSAGAFVLLFATLPRILLAFIKINHHIKNIISIGISVFICTKYTFFFSPVMLKRDPLSLVTFIGGILATLLVYEFVHYLNGDKPIIDSIT